MSSMVDAAVSRLSAITRKTPINWDAFDAVLKDLEDINAYDSQYEETVLSELIIDGGFYELGAVLADIVRHFLACGYDVTANEGLNGGLALQSLLWSSYDRYILDAAKVLMDAGAPANYRTNDDEPDEEPEGLLGSIGWKLSDAWSVDKDWAFANTLEAYYAMTEAYIAGKDYNAVNTYFTCTGQPLTAVSAIKDGEDSTLKNEGNLSAFSEPLVLWFGDKPLIAGCYTDYVVNPVYVDDKKDVLTNVSSAFSSLIGATLKEVQYIGSTICFLEFSNGMRLIFASREIGDRKRIGTFEIRPVGNAVDAEQLKIECICRISGRGYASTVTEYEEDALAFFCGEETFLLYLRPATAGGYRLGLCPCSRELADEYRWQFPLSKPTKTSWLYQQNELAAARLDYPEGYLYLATTCYYGIEIQLSEERFDPLKKSSLSDSKAKHMEFLKRKD